MTGVLDGVSISQYALSQLLLLFSLLSEYLLQSQSAVFEQYVLVLLEVAERYSTTEGLAY